MTDAPATPTRIEPRASSLTQPFWDATREHQLLIQWCTACDQPVWFPRVMCPACLGDQLEWREAAGTGTVYAVTVEHRPQNPAMAAMAPYAVALVELDEGIRLLTNIIGCDPTGVQVGQAVSVAWEPLSDGRQLPQFQPTTGA